MVLICPTVMFAPEIITGSINTYFLMTIMGIVNEATIPVMK